MTLPSLGTASPSPSPTLPLPPSTRLLWSERGRKFLRRPCLMATQYKRQWIFIENKGISSTSQNLRSEQISCSRQGVKDRWRIQLRTGPFVTCWWGSWETVRPQCHNAVYIIASDMRFTSNCCIRWMSEYDTVYKIVWCDFGLFNEGISNSLLSLTKSEDRPWAQLGSGILGQPLFCNSE